ncbi:MAG: DNA polymerase III subunit delta [candidate division WOR-3 bacterium]
MKQFKPERKTTVGFQRSQVSYYTYLQKLKAGVIYPAYFLFGSEHPAKYEFIEELKKVGSYQKVSELACATSVSEAKLNEFLADFYMRSLWAERRLLLVTDFQNLTTSAQKKLLELAKTLNAQSLITLVIESKYDSAVKALVEKYSIAVLNFYEADETTQIHQIIKMARDLGLTMDYDAARMLLELIGDNYYNLTQELNKIKVYLGSKTKVTQDTIFAISGLSKESSIEDFLTACLTRKLKESLVNFSRLRLDQIHPSVIISSLVRRILEVLLVKLSKSPESLSFSKSRLNKLLEYQRYWATNELTWFLDELFKIDRAIKSGYTNSYILLEELLVRTSKNYWSLS